MGDTILSIVHQLYGKNGSTYQSDPNKFLPYNKDENAQNNEATNFNPSPETIKILLKQIKLRKINGIILATIAELLPEWVNKYDN